MACETALACHLTPPDPLSKGEGESVSLPTREGGRGWGRKKNIRMKHKPVRSFIASVRQKMKLCSV